MNRALLWVVVVSLASSPALAQQPPDMPASKPGLRKIVGSLGPEPHLRPILEGLELARHQGSLSADDVSLLRTALDREFRPDNFRRLVTAELGADYEESPAHEAQTWVSSPLARRIRDLQVRPGPSEQERDKLDRRLQARPPKQQRLDLIERIKQAGKWRERYYEGLAQLLCGLKAERAGRNASGTVSQWNARRGMGFITLEPGGEEVFAHFSAFAVQGLQSLSEGQKVQLDTDCRLQGALVALNLHPTVLADRKPTRLENAHLDRLIEGFPGRYEPPYERLQRDLLHTFRELTDAELTQYADFLESPAGRWLVRAEASAAGKALQQVGRRSARRFAPPPGDDDPRVVRELVGLSDAQRQLEQLLATVDQAQRGKALTPDEAKLLQEALLAEFRPEAFRESGADYYETRFDKEQVSPVLAWARSPLGRKLRAMEEQAQLPGAEPERKKFLLQLETQPPGPERLALMDRLAQARRMPESSTEALLHVLCGMQVAAARGQRVTGTVEWFNDTKGYGSIALDGSKDTVFCHHSVIDEELIPGAGSLAEGQRVEVELGCWRKGLLAEVASPLRPEAPARVAARPAALARLIGKVHAQKPPTPESLRRALLFTYREASTEELEQYATFLQSHEQWLVNTDIGAMREAANRVGRRVAMRLLEARQP